MQKKYKMPMIRNNNMNLSPNEIDSIEDAGMLNKHPVKLIRTKGGFFIAVGHKGNGLGQEALAAGSHPAIVKYNLEKQYPGFQPSLMKSELYADNVKVDKHSHFLSDELRKSGHDIFSIQNDNSVEFQITKQNSQIHSVIGNLENGELVINEMNIDKQFTRALAGATTEKALECGLNKIRINRK
jgi:hypothetical protein